MIDGNERKYSVYKGLQRPIQFKGLKGDFIYVAFGLALSSLIAGVIIAAFSTILIGTTVITIMLFGGIIGMALFQRKYGLYRKNVEKGIYIFRSLFDKN